MIRFIKKFFSGGRECDHHWKYNFPAMPSRRICEECLIKEKLNLVSLEWVTDERIDTRSPETLIRDWV